MNRLIPLVLAFSLPSITHAQVLEGRLEPSGAPTFAAFGSALSCDGDVVAVGAPWTSIGGNNYAGAVHVYRRQGSTWSEEARLTLPGAEIHDNFGSGVALEGDVLVVGAPDFPVSSFTGRGNVYVYRFDGTNWNQEARLNGSDAGIDSGFGRTVALSGNTLIASARRLGNEKVYVFTYDGMSWNETTSFSAPQPSSRYGWSMKLLQDTALVAAPWQVVNAKPQAGAVHVYRRQGGIWGYEAELLDTNPEDLTEFGNDVDFDGTQAIVGAPRDVAHGISSGSAFLFERRGTTWSFVAHIDSPVPQSNARFGSQVAIEGDLMVVSAPSQDLPDTRSGAGYVYRKVGTRWGAEAPYKPSEAVLDWSFGGTLCHDGSRWVISASDPNAEGVAYVYDMAAPVGGFSLGFAPIPATAGEDMTVRIDGAQPSAPTAMLFGLQGRGNLYVPAPFDVTIGLANPGFLFALSTSANGTWSTTFAIPAEADGVDLWTQALQLGGVSNVCQMRFVTSN